MQQFFTNLISSIRVWDFIDVAIIAFVIYKILGFMRETRAGQLVKGLLALIAATILSGLIHLNATNWVLKSVIQFGVIALVVVFQPELRRGLEYIGRSKIFRQPFSIINNEQAAATAAAITEAVDYFSSNKVGAILALELDIKLSDFANTGVVLDGKVSAEFIKSIFYTGNPLHDGAVIIRGEYIHAAACILPLSKNEYLASEVGTRHRAGIGVSEVSDALVIIVSEETGIISQAKDGVLTRFLDIKTLEKTILNTYMEEMSDQVRKPFLGRFRRNKGAK